MLHSHVNFALISYKHICVPIYIYVYEFTTIHTFQVNYRTDIYCSFIQALKHLSLPLMYSVQVNPLFKHLYIIKSRLYNEFSSPH